MGNAFLKFLEKSPLLVGMRCPQNDCSRVVSAVSACEGIYCSRSCIVPSVSGAGTYARLPQLLCRCPRTTTNEDRRNHTWRNQKADLSERLGAGAWLR